MQEPREELRLQVALLQLVNILYACLLSIFPLMLLAFYIMQANLGTTTCSQPPNSATVGMNDITPPRIEDEEQEVIKMQHVHIQNAFVHLY